MTIKSLLIAIFALVFSCSAFSQDNTKSSMHKHHHKHHKMHHKHMKEGSKADKKEDKKEGTDKK